MSLAFLLLLAVIQGLTEFLPVSSSGHLALCQYFLNMPPAEGATLEVVLHGGTMISVLWFYRKKISSLVVGMCKREKSSWLYAAYIILASLPAAVLYALAHDFLEGVFDKPLIIAILMTISGCYLLSLKFLSRLTFTRQLNWWRALLVGLAQSIAILPGISRSGSTITTGRWLGMKSDEAMEFSFLMSLPVLGGGIILKLAELFSESISPLQWLFLLIASAVAAIVGLLSLKFLRFCQLLGRFWMFGIYCCAIGLISVLVILLRHLT